MNFGNPCADCGHDERAHEDEVYALAWWSPRACIVCECMEFLEFSGEDHAP